jgi:hypothetical protein
VARFGVDAALPDVLMALAACERRRDFSRPCGARFTDLAGFGGAMIQAALRLAQDTTTEYRDLRGRVETLMATNNGARADRPYRR